MQRILTSNSFYHFLLVAICCFLTYACSIKETSVEELNELVFTAESGEISTKTAFQPDEVSIWWSPGDEICIYYGASAGNRFTADNEVEVAKAEFHGTLNAFTGVTETGDFNYFWALYPYTSSVSCDGTGIVAVLPSTQVAKAGTFAPNTNITIAKSAGLALSFYNVCSWFRFSLEKEGVRKVTFSGNNNEDVAGKFKVSFGEDGKPAISDIINGVKEITLTPPNGESFEVGEMYYVTLFPQVFDEGFTVTIETNTEIGCRSIDVKATYLRSKYNTGVAFDKDVLYSQKEESDPNIHFADSNVKAALLFRGIDVDQDGEISYEEAASVTTVDKDFFGSYKKSVTSFNEFQYFTSVTTIGDYAFQDCTFASIVLPENLQSLGQYSFIRCRQLESIRIPEKVTTIGGSAFLGCYALSQIDLPAGLTDMGRSIFAYCTSLQEVVFPDGFGATGNSMFSECESLERVVLPNSLQRLTYGTFSGCIKLREIVGGEYLTEIGSRAFRNCVSLKTFHIPESVTTLGDENPFMGCVSLESLSGKYVAADGRSLIKDNTLIAFAFAGATNITYEVPANVKTIADSAFKDCVEMIGVVLHEGLTTIGDLAFCNCYNLKSVIIPSTVRTIGTGCFDDCQSLETLEFPEGMTVFEAQMCTGCSGLVKVTIPSTVKTFYNNVFFNCTSLSEVICKATTPPALRSSKFVNFDKDQDSFINTPESMKIYVPSGVVDIYKNTVVWSDHANQIEGVDFPDMENPSFYISTDYSQDGIPFTIQTATEGNGINIVIMGDCFVDKDIASGEYRQIMNHAVDVFFDVEPYASFRHLFNVYGVNVVSATEGYGLAQGKLSTWFGAGSAVGGSDSTVQEYARKALPSGDLSRTLIIVMMNRAYYAGTCYMYYNRVGDYGQGLSIAYFPLGTDDAMFAGLIQHEAGGHGFAKLADEYNYTSPIAASEIYSYKSQEPYGWWKNVDFTSDPIQVKWNSFLTDSRYDNENLGVYEGACTYATGAYRPSENSIMRHNTGGFNAPSREAIYYRIHKLAFGDNWTYDREAFIAYDIAARMNSTVRLKQRSQSSEYKNLPPLAPPVVIYTEDYTD